MPIEPITAAAAVGLIAPYLARMGEAAAEKIGEAGAGAAGKILAWLREKLTGGAREALDDLEKTPASEDHKAALRIQLGKALAADPKLAEELRTMLPGDEAEAGSMSQDVSGAGAKAAQVRGSGNTTTIS